MVKSRDELLTSGKGNRIVYVYFNTMFKGTFSIAIALRWVYKPSRWTEKTVSFKIISSWCQLKGHVTSYSLPEKAIQVCMLFKHHVQENFFDSNCIEMGVEALEMHWEDDKL